jgi:hypothetical protein
MGGLISTICTSLGLTNDRSNIPIKEDKDNLKKDGTNLQIKDGTNLTDYNYDQAKLLEESDKNLANWIKENILRDPILSNNKSCILYKCTNNEDVYKSDNNQYGFQLDKYTFYILETDSYYYCFKSDATKSDATKSDATKSDATKSDTNNTYTPFSLSVSYDNNKLILNEFKSSESSNINSKSYKIYKRPDETKIYCTSNCFIFKSDNKYIFNIPDQNTDLTITNTTTNTITITDEFKKIISQIQTGTTKLSNYINSLAALNAGKNFSVDIIRGLEIMFKDKDKDKGKYIFCTTIQKNECQAIDQLLFNLTYINNYVLRKPITLKQPVVNIDYNNTNSDYIYFKVDDKRMSIMYKDNNQFYYQFNELITGDLDLLNGFPKMKSDTEAIRTFMKEKINPSIDGNYIKFDNITKSSDDRTLDTETEYIQKINHILLSLNTCLTNVSLSDNSFVKKSWEDIPKYKYGLPKVFPTKDDY